MRRSKAPYARRWPRRFEGFGIGLSGLPGISLMSAVRPLFLPTAAGLVLFGAITLAVGFVHHETSVVLASLLGNGFALLFVALFLGLGSYGGLVAAAKPGLHRPGLHRADMCVTSRSSRGVGIPVSAGEPTSPVQDNGLASGAHPGPAVSSSTVVEPTAP